MLKPLYHNDFSGVGSGGRVAYEQSRFVPTENGFAEVKVQLSDFPDKKKCVPYTNYNAGVLIQSGKSLDRIPSMVMGVDSDDVERIEMETTVDSKD